MQLHLLYFARLRETFGLAGEPLELPAGTVADLLDTLRRRGKPWAEELGGERAFRVAVNQDMAGPDTPLADGDEVAIFPPVTGG
jgi:molybdopterin synthase sulfur carrier subunit